MVDSVTFFKFFSVTFFMPSVTFEKCSVTFFAQSVTIWLTVLHWRPKHAKCYF